MSLFTEAGLAAIEEAIAGGYTTIEYDQKRITYRSLDELLRIRNMIRARLGLTDPAPKRVSFKSSRGTSSEIEGAA